MIYIDDNGKVQCTRNCIGCDIDMKTCEAYKERRRAIRRELYKIKKERKLKEGD